MTPVIGRPSTEPGSPGVANVAVSVKSPTVAEPPAVLSTTFCNVSCAGLAVFVIVHVTLSAAPSVTWFPPVTAVARPRRPVRVIDRGAGLVLRVSASVYVPGATTRDTPAAVPGP